MYRLIILIIVILISGCQKSDTSSVQLSTAPVNYQPPKNTLVRDEDIIASIEDGILLTNEQARAVARKNITDYEEVSEEILNLINDYRKANGLANLEKDNTLEFIAMHRAAENAHMEWMETVSDNDGTHHLRPDGTYVSSIFSQYEKYGNYGEILGRRQADAKEVFEDWQLSEEHNNCMLSDMFLYFGSGVAQASNGDFYFVVEFMN